MPQNLEEEQYDYKSSQESTETETTDIDDTHEIYKVAHNCVSLIIKLALDQLNTEILHQTVCADHIGNNRVLRVGREDDKNVNEVEFSYNEISQTYLPERATGEEGDEVIDNIEQVHIESNIYTCTDKDITVNEVELSKNE